MRAAIGFVEQDEIVIRASTIDILSWVVGVMILVGLTRSVAGSITQEWDGSSLKGKVWAVLVVVFVVWLWRYAIDLALSAI